MSEGINLIEFYNKFLDEQAYRDYLEEARWNGKIVCPKCGVKDNSYKYSNGNLFKCGNCRKQFTVRVGTIFEDSKVGLQKWFLAVYLATSLKKGISSIQLSKYIGVTQKTAWFMLHRIRHAIENGTNTPPLNGDVEVIAAPDTKSGIITPLIRSNIDTKATIHTDEYPSYNPLTKIGYDNQKVNHSAKEWIYNETHTNTIEGFWSHLKRGINNQFQYKELICKT